MYRILVADDEGIMLEAFKSVISSTFGDSCITETAKTGRAVTEKAETFHPDIVFMDIHMRESTGSRQCGKYENSIRQHFFM